MPPPSSQKPSKRRKTIHDSTTLPKLGVGTITSVRELQALFTDYTNGNELRTFREFVYQFVNGQSDESETIRNRGILKDYLETQNQKIEQKGNGDGAGCGSYCDLLQMWDWATQNNSVPLLTQVAGTLALLVRVCSQNEDLQVYGRILIRSLLQPSSLRYIYGSLASNKDQVISPALRLLSEMNRFGLGALCTEVHAAFDFSQKYLTRNLGSRGASSKSEVEDPTKPSVRTLFVRFVLSFVQNGNLKVKTEVLGMREWISPLFKSIKSDIPSTVANTLETMTNYVLADLAIPNQVKTFVFNDWVLKRIAQLYAREEAVKVFRGGEEVDRLVAEVAHDFLLYACTSVGNGICFKSEEWYLDGERNPRRRTPKLVNRSLSALLQKIRPYGDALQMDLTLAIFKTCPELVADYFSTNSKFSFDPKLTSTWVGYCTFVGEVINLPLSSNFGTTPPPMRVLIENILPNPLSKPAMTSCLIDKNPFIRFLGARLLVSAFQKLRRVLQAMRDSSESVHDPNESWVNCCAEVLEEFCRRVPDITAVGLGLGTGKGTGIDGNVRLAMELNSRLLAEYYTTLPGLSLASTHDVNVLLGKVVSQNLKRNSGFKILETSHLLRVTQEVPHIKWWTKGQNMPHSTFVAILKLCSSTGRPREIRNILHSFVSNSYLFQFETAASSLDALLESLSKVASFSESSLEHVLRFLDEVIVRCIRGPFKYVDDYAQLLGCVLETEPDAAKLAPISPIIMTIAEQWKYLEHCEKDRMLTNWLKRFIENCLFVGENKYVLKALCVRLSRESFVDMQDLITDLEHISSSTDTYTQDENRTCVLEIPSSIRDLFQSPSRIVVSGLPELMQKLEHDKLEVTVFDLCVLQQYLARVLKHFKLADLHYVETLLRLMTLIISQLRAQGLGVAEKAQIAINVAEYWKIALEPAEDTRVVRLKAKVLQMHVQLFLTEPGHMDPRNDLLSSIEAWTAARYLDEVDADGKQMIFAAYESIGELYLSISDITELLSAGESQLMHSPLSLESLVKLFLSRLVEKGYQSCSAFETLISLIRVNVHLLDSGAVCKLLERCITLNILTKLDIEFCVSTEAQAALECSAIKHLEFYWVSAIKSLTKRLIKGENIGFLPERLLALFEKTDSNLLSTALGQFEPQRKILELLELARAKLFLGPLTAAHLTLLRRKDTFLTDRKVLLASIASNQRPNTISAPALEAIEILGDTAADYETPEMKKWFLKIFDHLTRRFAEDLKLNETVIASVSALIQLLRAKYVLLDRIISKASLNSVLEAGLQKHVMVHEVVELAAVLVSKSSPKLIETPKLLYIILGHENSPLRSRGSLDSIHLHLAYLAYRLFFTGSKTQVCNRSTLRSFLEVYRGSTNAVDIVLRQIIARIEAQLSCSCAGEIFSWHIVENVEGIPLITQVHRKLHLTIDARLILRGVSEATPIQRHFDAGCIDLKTFAKVFGVDGNDNCFTYDPLFMLPILTFCLESNKAIEAQTAAESHCVGFALTGLSSSNSEVRAMSLKYLCAVAVRLKDSSYRLRSQLTHFLNKILSTLYCTPSLLPLHHAVSAFLAHCSLIIMTPSHFLYESLMTLFLRSSQLNLTDIPHLLSLLHVGIDRHKNQLWIMDILVAGLKTERDLELYRQRNVFAHCLALYTENYATEKTKDRIMELLWVAANVKGGATTLITRYGVLGCLEQWHTLDGGTKEAKLRRLMLRLWECCEKQYVKGWSESHVGLILNEGF